jgi:hypothetical protein
MDLDSLRCGNDEVDGVPSRIARRRTPAEAGV